MKQTLYINTFHIARHRCYFKSGRMVPCARFLYHNARREIVQEEKYYHMKQTLYINTFHIARHY